MPKETSPNHTTQKNSGLEALETSIKESKQANEAYQKEKKARYSKIVSWELALVFLTSLWKILLSLKKNNPKLTVIFAIITVSFKGIEKIICALDHRTWWFTLRRILALLSPILWTGTLVALWIHVADESHIPVMFFIALCFIMVIIYDFKHKTLNHAEDKQYREEAEWKRQETFLKDVKESLTFEALHDQGKSEDKASIHHQAIQYTPLPTIKTGKNHALLFIEKNNQRKPIIWKILKSPISGTHLNWYKDIIQTMNQSSYLVPILEVGSKAMTEPDQYEETRHQVQYAQSYLDLPQYVSLKNLNVQNYYQKRMYLIILILIDAIQEMHHNHYIHGDLNSENILIHQKNMEEIMKKMEEMKNPASSNEKNTIKSLIQPTKDNPLIQIIDNGPDSMSACNQYPITPSHWAGALFGMNKYHKQQQAHLLPYMQIVFFLLETKNSKDLNAFGEILHKFEENECRIKQWMNAIILDQKLFLENPDGYLANQCFNIWQESCNQERSTYAVLK